MTIVNTSFPFQMLSISLTEKGVILFLYDNTSGLEFQYDIIPTWEIVHIDPNLSGSLNIISQPNFLNHFFMFLTH